MPSKRTTALLLGAAAAGAAVVVARRRLARPAPAAAPLQHDPQQPLAGDERELVMDDGGVISVTDAGPHDGVPVVLIHGWVNDRRVWSDVAPRLVESGHRVIAYDQRGHGRSRIGTAESTISRLGDDLLSVLDQLDVRNAVVAGHSMGGMATQAMLIDHPDQTRVQAIVLVATGAAGVGLPPRARALGAAVIGWRRGDSFVARDAIGTAIVRGAFGTHARPEHVLTCRDMLLGTPVEVRLAFFAAMNVMDLRKGLGSVKVPTAIIVGTRDTLTPPARARVINDAINGSTLDVLPGRGHMLPWEAPDEVTHLIEVAAKAS
jgi:pimeloyl-ACP methyl ester carboxylesterase